MTTPSSAASTPRGRGDPRRRRRTRIGVAIGIVVLLIIALVVTDGVLRAVAQSTAEHEIEQQLPEQVSGTVDVHIGGTSFLWQYLRGDFDRIEIDAPDLTVSGARLPVQVRATRVPRDLSSIGRVTARVKLSQRVLNRFADIPAATGSLKLGDGVVAFDGHRSAFGLTVNYRLAATPIAAGDRLLLSPAHAKITTGPVGLDFSSVIKHLLAMKPIPICLAPFLPKGVNITAVHVNPGVATITLHADDLAIDDHTFATHGECH